MQRRAATRKIIDMRSLTVALSALLALACDDGGSSPPAPDGQVVDARLPDAATDDGGSPDQGASDARVDQAQPDAAVADATAADAMVADAAPVEPDATPPDVPNPDDPLGLPLNLIPQGDEFMVAIIPDTQVYAERFPETFERHMRWLAERAAEYNIVFVSHVGDVVQRGDRANEWVAANAAYAWLRDIGLPHGLAIGSHDFSDPARYAGPIAPCDDVVGPSCTTQAFIEHFGAQHYADAPWYGGQSPTGRSSYQLIEASGMQLLFLHLMHDTPQEELDWAGEVLDAHPGTLVHLTTHRYMFDYRLTAILPPPLNLVQAGRFNALVYRLGDQGQSIPNAVPAEALFTDFVRQHPNIFAVHCGHVDAELRIQNNNVAGLPVYQALVDFQDMADGGGGWLRLLHFKPSADVIDVYTVSTETGALRADGDGFEHSIRLLTDYRNAYAEDLAEFGLDEAQIDALLAEVNMPGALRDQYYDSLYGAGLRDSRYRLQVDFSAYIDASR